jgi:hypothetical protein
MRYLNLSLRVLTAAAVFTLGAATTLADSLNVIPTLSGDTSNDGRAITPDGKYVVGLSGSRGFFYQVGAGSAINVIGTSDGSQSTIANGVGYRTYSGQTQLIISGNTTSGEAEWMTDNGGATFGNKRRNANWTYGQAMGAANQVGSKLGSDLYYVSTRSSAQTSQLVVMKGAGAWVPPSTYYIKGISGDQGAMNGMSASGRAVGWRGAGGTQANKNNYVLDAATSTAFNFNGLDGTISGEAFSVSADGLIVFGRSRTVADPNSYYGYKVVNPGASQTINALPELAGTLSNSGTRTVPYGCTADGRYAVGMDYVGVEKAVLWDVSDALTGNWHVLDLAALAASEGILDGWTRLSRAYSVGFYLDESVNQPHAVVTGIGVYGGATRAFVMDVMVPEPTTGALLGLGLLGLWVMRRKK